jgi:hypothetical protein
VINMTVRKNVANQLAGAKNAAERKRSQGESDAFEQSEIARLTSELERLDTINKEAAPVIEAMDQRQREAREAEELAATQRQNREQREFAEALDKHYQDRLGFYRQTRPGLPQEDFDRDIWPLLRTAYIAGEPDAVDQERLFRSTPVF